MVTDKKCWKKHSQWIKSLKGCIQLASRHLEGKKISKIKQVAADPYAAAAKGMSKTGRPTIMQPRQQMQPQQMHQVSQGAGNGGQAAVQMLNNAIVNNIPLAKQLLQNGTNPVPVGPEQNTALHIACTSGSYESVALLLQYHCLSMLCIECGLIFFKNVCSKRNPKSLTASLKRRKHGLALPKHNKNLSTLISIDYCTIFVSIRALYRASYCPDYCHIVPSWGEKRLGVNSYR